MKGRGKWEIPEKTRRPTASSGTIPTCEIPMTRSGIKPSSPWWEASVLIAQPPLALSGDGATDVRGSVTLIAPALPGLEERGKRFQVGGDLKRRMDRNIFYEIVVCAKTRISEWDGAARPRSRSERAIWATLTPTSRASSLLRARLRVGSEPLEINHRSQKCMNHDWVSTQIVVGSTFTPQARGDIVLKVTEEPHCVPSDRRRAEGEVTSGREFCDCEYQAVKERLAVAGLLDYILVRLLASHLGELGSIPGGGRSRIFARGNRIVLCISWLAGFLGDLPFSPPFHSGAAPFSPNFTLIGSQDLADGNTARLARRRDEALGVRVTVPVSLPRFFTLVAQLQSHKSR
ncbi:hypothetical protein PR048_021903 [Dryococelus australis]|uniref:Uncharacterized protein n=1 Tax=Dryococelus australis TaxID=614101 RepID=A0ABQ9GZQ1_9NEOP|nr:hypothetical protein PR048_021903 [Dryococelus australis]